MTRRARRWRTGLFLIALFAGASEASEQVDAVLVQIREPSAGGAALASGWMQRLGRSVGASLHYERRLAGGWYRLRIDAGRSLADAAALAQRLAADPSVIAAEPDRWVRPLWQPDDLRFAEQWSAQDKEREAAAINLPGAWDITQGRDVVVAILDTGILAHADLSAARRLAGYDFISDTQAANDGDGRDADPTDPGDWVLPSEFSPTCTDVQPSSWHGTQVAGIIGAESNNALGIAGINGHARILPVRVLGKCGGRLSDLLEGARWAAGLPVPGAPPNPNPARVLNLSLGSDGACTPFIDSAVRDILAAGAVLVAAGGNGTGDASQVSPGNCAGVIAVSAVDRAGERARYSRAGANVALSAPGGAQQFLNDPSGILSTSNAGTQAAQPSPSGDRYVFRQGTSEAAPQVTGVVSLMLSVNPALQPGQVATLLRETARPFPPTSSCSQGGCGVGMLDAATAVGAAQALLPAPRP